MKKLLVIFVVLLFAAPAMAVDWNFYGSARIATFYISNDDDEAGDRGDLSGVGTLGPGETEDDQVQWQLQGNSRLGAKVKHEAVRGQVELGLEDDTGDNATTRRIYGTWDFGAGTLKIGKDYTPVHQFISGQVYDTDLGLLGYGTAYGDRVGQISLRFGGFEIALINNTSDDLLGGMTDGDVDWYLPKIEAEYGMSWDTFNFKIIGGFQTYTIEDVSQDPTVGTGSGDVDVTSWTIGGDAGMNFGPAYVKAALNYGNNVDNADWHIAPAGVQGGFARWDGDDGTDDVSTMMGALVAGFKVSDMLSFEGGFGYRLDKPDDSSFNPADDDDEAWSMYVQGVIALAPGVWVIPEVGYYDYMKDFNDNDEGSQFYLGGKWQIDF